MSRRQNPASADLLRLTGPWLAGAKLAAGECLLSRQWWPAKLLLGHDCGHDGCPVTVVAPTVEQLNANIANHRRRCHA